MSKTIWDELTPVQDNNNKDIWAELTPIEKSKPKENEWEIKEYKKPTIVDNIVNSVKWVAQTPVYAYMEGMQNVELADLEFKDMFNPLNMNDKQRLEQLNQIEPETFGIPENKKWESFKGSFDDFYLSNPEPLINFAKKGLVEAGRMLPMTVETIKSGGLGSIAGGAVGAVGGLVASKTPTGALEGFKLGVKLGGGAGATKRSFELETGFARSEFKNFRDKDGNPLPDEIINTASVGVGSVNAVLEMVGLRAMLKTLPGGDKISSKLSKEGIKKIATNETVKAQLLKLSKNYAIGVGGETSTEVLQEISNIVAGEIAKDIGGNFEATPMEKHIARIIETGVSALGATIFIGGAPTSVSAVNILRKQGFSDRQVQETIANMTPEEQAQFINQNTDTLIQIGEEQYKDEIIKAQRIERIEKAKEVFFEKAIQSGRTEEEANAVSQIFASGINTFAERFGVQAEELASKVTLSGGVSMNVAESLQTENAQNMSANQIVDGEQSAVVKENLTTENELVGNTEQLKEGQAFFQENIDKPLKELGYNDDVYYKETNPLDVTKEQSDIIKVYKKQVNDFVKNPVKNKGQLTLGETPQALIEAGLEQLPMETATHIIKKILGGKKDHNVDIKTVKNLPTLLANPVSVFKSKTQDNSVIVLVDALDKKNKPVMVSIEKNNDKKGYMVNFVSSAYGKNQNWFKDLIKDGGLLKINKNKIPSWLQVINNPSSSVRENLKSANVNQRQDKNIINDVNPNFNPNETFYQDAGNPKGSYNTATNEIKLSQNADKSTLLHELGHFFLQQYVEISAQNEDAKLELEKLNNWLGYNGVEYTKAQHEKFARGFEAYVMTGKAPNNFIKTAFDTFKQWLIDIYGTVQNLGVELSDDAISFYDSLFQPMSESEMLESANKVLKQAETVTLRRNDMRLTAKEKRYKETAYDILAQATGRNKNWLKANLESKKETDRVIKNKEKIELLVKNSEDKIDQFNSDWAEFFGGNNFYEDAELNQGVELARQAFDVILNKSYIGYGNEYKYLEQNERIYQYILSDYKTGQNRDISQVAFYQWQDKIKKEFGEDLAESFAERFLADTAEIERTEKLDKFERAKEAILRSADMLTDFDRVKEFENIVKTVFENINFLTSKDKQKLMNNILALKSVDDLKNNINSIIDVAETLDDISYRKIVSEKIQKEIKVASKPVKKGTQKAGKYDYTTNKTFLQLKDLNKLTVEEANELRLNMNLNEAEQEGLSFENKLINKFINYKANGNVYMSSDALAELYRDIIKLKIAGEMSKKEADLEKILNQTNRLDELNDTIDGKNKANKLTVQYILRVANWESYLNGVFNKKISDEYSLLQMEKDVEVFKWKEKNELLRQISEVLGVKLDKASGFLIDRVAEKFTFNETVEGEIFPKEFNKMELITAYIYYKNPVLAERLNKQFGEEQLQSMFNVLTEEDKQLGDVMQRFAERYYHEANKVFIRKYGLDLPKVFNYFPSKSEHTSEIDILTNYVQSTSNPSFIKQRSKDAIVVLNNPLTILHQHIDQMTRFTKTAEKLDLYGRVFKNPRLKRRIINKYGEDVHHSLMLKLTDYSYTNKVAYTDYVNTSFEKLVNNWVGSNIAFKPTIALKQLLSSVNYSENMPYMEWHAGYLKAIADPKGTLEFMEENSEYLKQRFESGGQDEYLSRMIENAKLAKLEAKKYGALTWFTRMGDRGSVVFGGKPYVDYLIKQGYSKPEAFKEFENQTMRSMQAGFASALSDNQNRVKIPLFRAIMSYMNSLMQYTRKIGDSILAYKNGDIDKKQLAKTIYLYHFLAPFLYNIFTSGSIYKLFIEGDPEELINDALYSLLTGNIGAIWGIGDLFVSSVSTLLGRKVFDREIPILSEVKEMGIDLANILMGEGDIKDFMDLIGMLVTLESGLPVKTIFNALDGLVDITEGTPVTGFSRVIGYTEKTADNFTGGR